MTEENYDAVIVGTGFASTFFLDEYLRHAAESSRVLVLERGGRGAPIDFDSTIVNETPQKAWLQRLAFGGGTCWTGNTPRLHPNDFRTKSLYGVGDDWPLDYDELEPYYVQVEELMGISGSDQGPYPRSKPYPLPPHKFNALDELLAKKYPGLHIPLPSARASSPVIGRSVCCTNGVCSTCPIGAKFQIDLHMAHVYDDRRVELRLDANVDRLDIAGDAVRGVHFFVDGKEHHAKCDLAAVGAHAIMSPFILLKSGLGDRALGRYLNEQVGVEVDLMLDGVQNYGGSQQVTGLGLMLLDGNFRSKRAGCLVENWNLPWLRAERGRWRERGSWTFVFEDVPSFDNYVAVSEAEPSKPKVYYPKHSLYLGKALAEMQRHVQELVSGLPVEEYHIRDMEGLGGVRHIQGTTRMGTDAKSSVVDATCRHHRVRNLLALGSGLFPTCPAANPTLTLCALSVRAAKKLFS